MRIAEIMTTVLFVPYIRPYVISSAAVLEGEARLLVRVVTDNGLQGIGEGAPTPGYGPDTVGTVDHVIREFLYPALLGQDPFDVELIEEQMDRAIPGHEMAKAAVDMALYDLMGRELGLSAHKLLGGLYRKQIPLVGPIGISDTEEMAELANQYVEAGFKTLKLKVGIDPRADLEHVAEVRRVVGPDILIRVDANQGYRLAEHMPTLRKLDRFDLEFIEQPLPAWDVDGMRTLSAVLDTPILADESVYSPRDVLTLIRRQAADAINIKVAKTGLTNGKRVAAIAEAAGLPCIVGSMVELGPGCAASMHFAAATRNVTHACESLTPALLFAADVIKEDTYSVLPDTGAFVIGQEPGFGFTLREEVDRLFTAPPAPSPIHRLQAEAHSKS
jgi:o-succinylbenzoate synthase